MITEQQEQNLQSANDRRTAKRQDRTNPHVINVNDGRLMPNTQRLRQHKEYRVYTGPSNADLPTRMRWLEGMRRRAPKIIDSSTDAADEPFDIGKATKEDIAVFAMENFGKVFDLSLPLKTMREELKKLADAEAVQELA